MRRGWLLALLLAACPEAPAEVVDAGPPPPPEVARLKTATGAVTLTHAGTRAAARPGPLFEGDVLETGADGYALLTSRGREVEVFEDSTLHVAATLTDLSASDGTLTFEDTEGGTLSTRSGEVRGAPGLKLRVESRDGGGPVFIVSAGSLEFLDDEVDGGAHQKVQAGERWQAGVGMLEFEPAPAPPPPPAKAGVQLSARGKVQLRAKGRPATDVPSGGLLLDAPAAFSVDRAGQLEATAEGTRLSFSGGASGTVAPRDGEPAVGATLQRGGLRVFLQPGHSVLIEGKKPLLLSAKTTLTALVTPGPRVELLGGDGDAALNGGLPRKVSAGEVVQPKGKGLDATRLAAVTTLQPGRAQRVYWSRPGPVALQFPAGDGEVEVATDAAFEQLLISAAPTETLTVPAPLSGTLFWRRKGGEASSARFERDTSGGHVSSKNDTVAETGLKATVYFQSAVPSLTFTFPANANASGWRFRLYAAGDLKTPVVERKVAENRAQVDSGTLKEGSYLWSATALDARGAELPGGRMNKMDVVFDNSVTRLVLSAPREGEAATLAVGVAPLGSRLSLNGRAVPLDAQGRFSVPTQRAKVLLFRLVTRDGVESTWVRHTR